MYIYMYIYTYSPICLFFLSSTRTNITKYSKVSMTYSLRGGVGHFMSYVLKYLYICMCVYIYVYIYIYIYICVYIYIYVYIYVYIYIHALGVMRTKQGINRCFEIYYGRPFNALQRTATHCNA